MSLPIFKNLSRSFLLLLTLGLVIRIIVMFWSFNFRENTDVLRYRDWARIGHIYSLSDAYKIDHLSFGTIPTNMPPGSLYTIQASYNLNIQVSKMILKITHANEGSLQWVNGPLLSSFLRMPSIISDLIIGLLIYKLVSIRVSEKNALVAASLFLFNPVILYNSAFWGQMDAINNALFYLGLYLLFRKKYFFSILCYLLSLYVKLSLLPFLPIIFLSLYMLERKNKIKLFLSTAISVIFIFIMTLSISSNPITWFYQFLNRNAFPEMQNITNFSFNFWWLIFKPWIAIGKPTSLFNFSEIRLINSPLGSQTFFNLPLNLWGYILFILLVIPFLAKIIKSKLMEHNLSFIPLIFSSYAFLLFLFLPNMHERYLYPVFPLLATYVGLKQKFLLTFIALSILNFINLYIVWHPMALPFMPYTIMNNQNFQWLISLLTVFIGLSLYIRSLKTIYATNK